MTATLTDSSAVIYIFARLTLFYSRPPDDCRFDYVPYEDFRLRREVIRGRDHCIISGTLGNLRTEQVRSYPTTKTTATSKNNQLTPLPTVDPSRHLALAGEGGKHRISIQPEGKRGGGALLPSN